MKHNIVKMDKKAIAMARVLETELSKLPQPQLTTLHSLHSGVYTRTIKMQKGQLLVGAYIKVDTTLLIQGRLRLTVGDSVTEVDGFEVFTASGGRKQTMLALEDTFVTMVFATDATTVEEAEEEFTDEYEKLLSRDKDAINIIRGVI